MRSFGNSSPVWPTRECFENKTSFQIQFMLWFETGLLLQFSLSWQRTTAIVLSFLHQGVCLLLCVKSLCFDYESLWPKGCGNEAVLPITLGCVLLSCRWCLGCVMLLCRLCVYMCMCLELSFCISPTVLQFCETSQLFQVQFPYVRVTSLSCG